MKKLHSEYYHTLHNFHFLKTINVLHKLSHLPPHKNVFNFYVALSLMTLIFIFLKCSNNVTLLHKIGKKSVNFKKSNHPQSVPLPKGKLGLYTMSLNILLGFCNEV